MKAVEKLQKQITAGANMLARKMVEQNANSACIWLVYQPEFPREAEQFKKIAKKKGK